MVKKCDVTMYLMYRNSHNISSLRIFISKMDIWLNASRSKEDSSKCDFCYQSGITVKPLSCSRHFYCGVCEKFAPKFYKRSDYTCSRCSGLPKSRHHRINLDLSPTTPDSHSSKKKQSFKEVTIAVEGGNIISFCGKYFCWSEHRSLCEAPDCPNSHHISQSVNIHTKRVRSNIFMRTPFFAGLKA